MSKQSDLRHDIVALIPRLRRFARGLTGNQTDADDLVQVALEKALTRLHQFEPGTRLDSWLYRIVQTSFLDDRRKAQRREVEMAGDQLENMPNVAQQGGSEQSAGLADIDRALAVLPDEQRLIVVAVLVEGHSYREVADMMALPIGTVMSRLSRARKSLQAALSEGTER